MAVMAGGEVEWPAMKSHCGGLVFRIAAMLAICLMASGGFAEARAAGAHRGAAAARSRHARAEAPPAVPLDQIKTFDSLPAPFALDARAAMLVDARSGDVLYAYNEHEKMQPASLAKMMTFYLTMEALQQKRITLDTEVPISEAAWRLSLNSSVSRMFLRVGQTVPVKQLLFGLMVSSGNDAAVALSEYLAGSPDAFAQQMNQKAKELGLDETHFVNPDGLPADDEYTTAADMVKLGRALTQKFPNAEEFTSAKDFTFDNITQRNFNTLLFYDSRVTGIKTGHVQEAGFHLVASAKENDLYLISAVMGTPSMEKRRVETEKLLAWAFRTFTTVSPDWRKSAPATIRVYKGDLVEVPIAPAGGTPYFTVLQGQEHRVKLAATLQSTPLIAPVPKGATVGELAVTIAGKPVSSTPMITQVEVKPGGLVHNTIDSIRLRL